MFGGSFFPQINLGGVGQDIGNRLSTATSNPLFMAGIQMMANHGQPNTSAFDGVPQAIMAANRLKSDKEEKDLARQKAERISSFIGKRYPEYAQLALDDPDMAIKLATQKGSGNAKDEWMTVGNRLHNPATGEWRTPPGGTEDTEEWGLSPVWGTDGEGKTVLGQISKSGKFKPLDTGGFTPTPGISNIDTGTGTRTINNRTGATITETTKDIAGSEYQKEIGKADGAADASAPNDYQAGVNAKALIKSIKEDPALEWGTGFSSYGNLVRGTPGYDFQNKVEQAKSGAFLTAIQQMRGLGALSNTEGTAATAAVNRMNTATSTEEFLSAVNDFELILDQGIAKAQARMNGRTLKGPQPDGKGGRTTSSGITYEVEK